MSAEVFKLEGKITIDSTSAEKAIDKTTNKANLAQSKIGNALRSIGEAAIESFEQAENGSGKSLAQIAKDSGKTVNQVKSDVMKAAKGYKDNGITMSDAMKKAYADIGYVSKGTTKQVSEDAEEASKEIVEHTEDAEKKVKNSSNGIGKAFSKMFSGIGKAAGVCGKAIVTGLGAGAAAMGKLVVDSMGLAGELEQNLGGSEAVFKHWSAQVQGSAKEAYKNMGLSESEYLANANKMGALFQGMGFSIGESASMSADMMQRAADVASIMGIPLESAMEAVNGMAKGNFTMMDNLGVAMNDTALAAYAVEKGITKSYQSMSQNEKIGLAYEMFMERSAYAAGNYAKENDTLSGSLNTAKAAWKNFLSGSDAGTSENGINAMVESFVNVGDVVIKNLNKLLPKLTKGLTTLIQRLTPYIPTMLQAVLPGLIEGSVALITGLALALPDIIEILIEQLPYLFEQLASAAEKVFPVLQESFANILESIDWAALGAGIGEFIRQLPQILADLGSTIGYIWETAVWPMIQGLFKEFGIELPSWETLKTQFEEWWNGLVSSVNELIKAVFSLDFSAEDENGVPWYERIWNWFVDVMAALGGALFALFGIDVDELAKSVASTVKLIQDWWEQVKANIALSLGFTVDPPGSNEPVHSGTAHGVANGTGRGQSGAGGAYSTWLNDNSGVMGMRLPGFATGLDFVPRDNYLARLHYGESVLTKEEATAWRNGQQSGIDYDRLAEAMAQRPMAFNIDGKAFAVMLARELSRSIGNRNIQTMMAMGG